MSVVPRHPAMPATFEVIVDGRCWSAGAGVCVVGGGRGLPTAQTKRSVSVGSTLGGWGGFTGGGAGARRGSQEPAGVHRGMHRH